MTTIRANYSRTDRDDQKGVEITVGGSVTITLNDEADWRQAWTSAVNELRAEVHEALGQQLVDGNPSEPAPESDATEEVSQSDENVRDADPIAILTELAQAKTPVEYTGCRVMFSPRHLEQQGNRREQVRMRIGGGDQIPGQYVDAKGTEPDIIQLMLKSFRQGDFVNVRGYFEQWTKKGNDGTTQPQFDLIVETIERA